MATYNEIKLYRTLQVEVCIFQKKKNYHKLCISIVDFLYFKTIYHKLNAGLDVSDFGVTGKNIVLRATIFPSIPACGKIKVLTQIIPNYPDTENNNTKNKNFIYKGGLRPKLYPCLWRKSLVQSFVVFWSDFTKL